MNGVAGQPPLRLSTISQYLRGDGDAILAVAGNRSSLWVAFVFVLSAGFAREYDGEELLAEPWHLVLPLAASTVTSLILFTCVFAVARRHGMKESSFPNLYMMFLSLYWMTAPLAWLYAIPVERFLGEADALRANLCLLGLIAAWRVALIIRVTRVLYGAALWQAVCLVLAFADAVALMLMSTVDIRLIQIMGGVRMTEAEQLIANVTESVILLGIVTVPVWLIGLTRTIAIWREPTWKLAVAPVGNDGTTGSVRLLTILSLVIWLPILPTTQAEQQLRFRVEREFDAGAIEKAIGIMSAHSPNDFPPHWSPPPQLGRRSSKTRQLLQIVDKVLILDPAPWVRETYIDKLPLLFGSPMSVNTYWNYNADIEELSLLVGILERLPDSEAAAVLPPHSRQEIALNTDDHPAKQELTTRLLTRLDLLSDNETHPNMLKSGGRVE